MAYDEEKASQPKKKKPKPKPARSAPPPDEPDDLSAISDEEPDPNDEPQFKYSTAGLADDGCRGNNCCVISMIILCVIVAIVLSVVMVKVFNKQDEENQAPPPTMAPTTKEQANQTGIGMFMSSMSTIEETSCTSSTANTNTCRNACTGFECCDPTLADSCFSNNPDGCLNYKRCHVTSSGIGVPPPNLEAICAPDDVAASPDSCQNACASVACCWQSNVTCYDKIYTCLDYSPCQNLRTNVRVPAATSAVAQFCDPTQAGSLTQATECETACQAAECCWSEDPAENCLKTDFVACMSYKACGLLELPPAGELVFLPPTSLRDDCTITKINTGDTAACEAACEVGSCCMDGTAEDCFATDPLACLAYEPCGALPP